MTPPEVWELPLPRPASAAGRVELDTGATVLTSYAADRAAGFADFSPDACLINRYEPGASRGASAHGRAALQPHVSQGAVGGLRAGRSTNSMVRPSGSTA